ncbi:AraC family transcriptional regulator [Vibrio sp. CAIM 722]|uniref:AraC family transcriptional regulator n=1 Tax=Vibrio eleionomae TaxID=2653505 RepID=A0A7X4LK12_9VIBR|nr:DJ-1/PfpI family protein [Vibrio eleionomae]MZI93200.1 AraC family transcriptional regulator [Vibrio eleionomae]
MDIAILTFDGFNELDSLIAASVLGRMSPFGWNIQITCPSESVTSMNGIVVTAQQPLEFANTADVVLVGSGTKTREIVNDRNIMNRLSLNTEKQLIGAQCSGALLLAKLGLLADIPVCTDVTTKPWVIESGVTVLDQAFYAAGNMATAGGCLSSLYLSAWVIAKLFSIEQAQAIIDYVAPVGEKPQTVERCMSAITPYL